MTVSKQSIVTLVVIIVLVVLIAVIGHQIPESTIRQTVTNAGPYGVALLIIFFWVANVFAPLSGSPFLFTGFYLYGQKVVIYAYIASLIAAVSNYWIARLWGRSLVEKLAGADNLAKIDALTISHGVPTLLIFRLFLRDFHDVVSYAFGLTSIKFTPYMIISTLGMLPFTIFWYFLSFKIHDPLTFTGVSWLIATVSVVAYVLWIKLTRRRPKMVDQMKK